MKAARSLQRGKRERRLESKRAAVLERKEARGKGNQPYISANLAGGRRRNAGRLQSKMRSEMITSDLRKGLGGPRCRDDEEEPAQLSIL